MNEKRTAFVTRLKKYIETANLPWKIIEYDDEPLLIGVSMRYYPPLQRCEASSLVEDVVWRIGLNDVVKSYQGKLNWCYIELKEEQ